jgi:serine/threonine protein phosphatase PrpC
MRDYQEDRYFTPDSPSLIVHAAGDLFGVFDGHGGANCSTYLQEHFPGAFLKHYDETAEDAFEDHVGEMEKKYYVNISKNAMRKAFRQMADETSQMRDGSTASVVWVIRGLNIAVCGVVGDSPIVIGTGVRSYHLGPDHNARSNPKERKAAEKRGAFYSGGYLCTSWKGGGLQMARAMGDSSLRFLSHVPQVYQQRVHDFVLVGTDGIMDPGHQSHDMLPDMVAAIREGATAEQIVKTAVAIPTGDNATALLWRP